MHVFFPLLGMFKNKRYLKPLFFKTSSPNLQSVKNKLSVKKTLKKQLFRFETHWMLKITKQQKSHEKRAGIESRTSNGCASISYKGHNTLASPSVTPTHIYLQ